MYTYGHWECQFKIDFNKAISFVYQINIMNHTYIGFKNLYSKLYNLPIIDSVKESNWKTYTSSSKIVNKLLKNGNDAQFIILKVFDNTSDAMAYERKLLVINDARNNEKFINNTNGFILNSMELIDRDKAISKSISILWKDKTYRQKTIEGQKHKIVPKMKPKSDEQKRKMSEIGKKLWSDPEYYTKHVNRTRLTDYMNSLSDEEKHEHYQNCIKDNPYFKKGHGFSDEALKKMSDAKKGTRLSKETRSKISESNRGVIRTDEYRKNMSMIQSNIKRNYVYYLEIDGIRYKSYRQASKLLDINPEIIKNRCLSDEYTNYIVVFRNIKEKHKPKSYKVSIDDIVYNSISDAGTKLGICRNVISKRINSDDFPNYKKI